VQKVVMKIPPKKQGDLDFSVAPRLQTIWGIREASVFFLEGLSVTLFMAFAFLKFVPGMVLSIALLIAAVLLLLSHLGHPMRAWLAILNFRNSWVSRGTVVIGTFVGLGTVYVGMPAVLHIEMGESMTLAIGLSLIVAAIFILVYPGFVMSASPAIPFWSSGLLPVLSLINGLASGLMVVLLIDLTPVLRVDTTVGSIDLAWLEQSILITLGLVTLFFFVTMNNAGAAARLSVNYLMTQEPILFWVLAVGAGLVLPIVAIALTLTFDVAPVSLLWIAVGTRLVGDVAARYAILKGGIYEAVMQPTYRA
jgi:formate-dependent nitrite reductase membrane component NrfD